MKGGIRIPTFSATFVPKMRSFSSRSQNDPPPTT